MRRGATLLELLLVLAITGILLALSLPAITGLHDRLRVDAAVRALMAAHVRARFLAIAEQRAAVLDLSAGRLLIRAVESPGDTVARWESAGPDAERVSVTGLPHRFAFAPSGIGLGVNNTTYTVQRGSAIRRVIVSRYGRIRLD